MNIFVNKEDRLKFEIWCGKFSNLKKYCKTHPLNLYSVYKAMQKQKNKNVLLNFAFELMEKLEVNEIKYENFSTKTLKSGAVCATLYGKTIFEIYHKFNESENTNDFNK